MILISDVDPGRGRLNPTKSRRAFQLGGNIFLYATGKENLRHKGDSYLVRSTNEGSRSIQIAKLMLGDNADPEPGGWPQLTGIMLNENRVRLEVAPVKLGGGDLAKYKIAHLTGTTKLLLKDAQHKELKAFVEGGGTLIIDSAGGSSVFAESVEWSSSRCSARPPRLAWHRHCPSPTRYSVRYNGSPMRIFIAAMPAKN